MAQLQYAAGFQFACELVTAAKNRDEVLIFPREKIPQTWQVRICTVQDLCSNVILGRGSWVQSSNGFARSSILEG